MSAPVTIDPAIYRQVLGYFPTGVVVITATTDASRPVGMAVGSFCSVSLDPPLVTFYAGKTSSSWPQIEAAGKFCVNILTADQEHISRRFASSGGDKFADVGWSSSTGGCPRLDSVLAWIECTIDSVADAGDHVCVFGRVSGLEVADNGGMPLVFFRGGYGRLVT